MLLESRGVSGARCSLFERSILLRMVAAFRATGAYFATYLRATSSEASLVTSAYGLLFNRDTRQGRFL
ncbi:hypothetical protein AMJ40_02015 [candidate division TA06 bacterium DG_26]|uniref:Uncharacterized protein n=1 Tax=candidate division TA06 bacterium DG_26 TaxID=1703771 RepID=A0A0S7WKS5_UNCT6|nr:MAG: hypothetical protein AMJ40_02015 [candidate division TA06 bacterium DG_26]